MKKRLLFLLIDALGISPVWKGNALLSADSRYLFDLFSSNIHFLLEHKELANSYYSQELLHSVISTGKNQISNKGYLDKIIEDKSIFGKEAVLGMYDQVKRRNATLHLVGCLPHSHSKYSSLNQLLALVKHARSQGVLNIKFHLFLDENIDLNTATLTINELERELANMQAGHVATVAGMNCLINPNKVKELLRALILRKGQKVLSAGQAVAQMASDSGFNLSPHIIVEGSRSAGKLSDFDIVLFFNSISSQLESVLASNLSSDHIKDFLISYKVPNFLSLISIFHSPGNEQKISCIESRNFEGSLPKMFSEHNLTQAEVSDSSRIDYFGEYFDGNAAIKGLEKLFVPLGDPFLTTDKITKSTASILVEKQFDVVYCEYSILDIFNKILDFTSATKALNKVDLALKELVPLAQMNGYQVVLGSNHGGIEKMADLNEIERLNQKTTNPTPFVIVGHQIKKITKFSNIHDHFLYDMMKRRNNLYDISPTLLALLNLPIDKKIEGASLLQNEGRVI